MATTNTSSFVKRRQTLFTSILTKLFHIWYQRKVVAVILVYQELWVQLYCITGLWSSRQVTHYPPFPLTDVRQSLRKKDKSLIIIREHFFQNGLLLMVLVSKAVQSQPLVLQLSTSFQDSQNTEWERLYYYIPCWLTSMRNKKNNQRPVEIQSSAVDFQTAVLCFYCVLYCYY